MYIMFITKFYIVAKLLYKNNFIQYLLNMDYQYKIGRRIGIAFKVKWELIQLYFS